MNSFQRMVRRYTGANITLSARELKHVEKRSSQLFAEQQRRFWIIMALAVATAGLSVTLGSMLLAPLLAATMGWRETWCKAGSALVIAILVTAVWMYMFVRLYVRPLRRALSEMGYEVCVRCGYWLRGLPANVSNCPECGTERAAPNPERQP
jgi:hypothetical protein